MSLSVSFRELKRWPRPSTLSLARPEKPARPFRATYQRTLEKLEAELRRVGAENVVLQMVLDVGSLRRDGLPRASAKPEHAGVILSFDSRHGRVRLQTAEFEDWRHNLRAIALAIESLRRVDRYGVVEHAGGPWPVSALAAAAAGPRAYRTADDQRRRAA